MGCEKEYNSRHFWDSTESIHQYIYLYFLSISFPVTVLDNLLSQDPTPSFFDTMKYSVAVQLAVVAVSGPPWASGFTPILPSLTQRHTALKVVSRDGPSMETTTTYDEDFIKKDFEPTPSCEGATDIMLDVDGNPLSNEYFMKTMGVSKVDYYTCPEEDAFRGIMSNGCRVHLWPTNDTAFFKRIAFEQLDHAFEKLRAAPFKLLRDIKSYQVVAAFLTSQGCQLMTKTTGVHIPTCYDAQMRPNELNPMDSKFTFLLEDFSPAKGWYQEWLLDDTEEIEATLTTLAKIHAFFWNGSDFYKNQDAAAEFEAAVWPSGSYIQPQAQPAGQWKKVAEEWLTKRMKFKKELSGFDYWDNLGERLQSVAEECGRLAHPFAEDTGPLSEQYQQFRTFTHGDPKQANLFFLRDSTTTDSKPQVGLVDFQWSGFGLAATDIAHFLTSAVHADQLVNGGEAVLQKYYFEELQKYLVEYGAYETASIARSNFSYDTFAEQYDTALLDLVRLVVAYTWERFEEPVEKDDIAACARTMNKTSYNKSIPNIIWLMSRCDEVLKSRGV